MKKAILILVCASFLFVTSCADKSKEPSGNIPEPNPISDFKYLLDEELGMFIMEYIGTDKNVVIPSAIDGHAVTHIGMGAFSGTDIESVVIPDSVTVVMTMAFSRCEQLKTVDFGDSIFEIQAEAFRDCTSLEEIILPKNIKALGDGAFFACTSATEIYIPKTLTNWNDTYQYSIFGGCIALKTLTIEDGVTTLGGYGTFRGASALKKLVIPASVNAIGDFAFHSAVALESVTFLGDAPQLTEGVFGYPNSETVSPNLVIYYNPNTNGWDDTILNQYQLVPICDITE